MKQGIFLSLMALLVWACSPVKETVKTSATLAQDGQDSTEYEIIIIDPQFDQWYFINYTPAKDYSNDFYRSKNLMAVANWNYFYNTGRHNRVVDCYIDYRPDIDYGIEVNRRLYWYFKYINDTFKVKLI